MTLSQTRQAIADALNTVGAFKVLATRPKNQKVREGWVRVTKVEPGDYFGTANGTFEAVILLDSDETKAEGLVDTHAVNLINSLVPLAVAGLSMEMVSLAVGTNAAPLYALVLTMTLEVN